MSGKSSNDKIYLQKQSNSYTQSAKTKKVIHNTEKKPENRMSDQLNQNYMSMLSHMKQSDESVSDHTSFTQMIHDRQMQMKEKLANIELQVEKEQKELAEQRQTGRYTAVPIQAFRPSTEGKSEGSGSQRMISDSSAHKGSQNNYQTEDLKYK